MDVMQSYLATASASSGGSTWYVWGILAFITLATVMKYPDAKNRFGAERARRLMVMMAVVLGFFAVLAVMLTVRQ